MLQKLLRIVIFALLVSFIMMYIPDSKLECDDLTKIISATTIVFIIYDFYYPTVRVELKKEDLK
jgi:hypothetical protein